MTGRDLIVYILSNGLENEQVFKDGTFIGFITESEVAEKLGVGIATVHAWISEGYLYAVQINNTFYIPADFSIFGQQIK